MNENGKKRREWVKTAAIVFLSIMLVLTFFSQTIMNYSLPEVATQYVSSGTITAKIRGSGVVESGDPYKVTVSKSRKVASVEVRAGDVVQKGDVLFYLEEGEESEELKEALKALETEKDGLKAAEKNLREMQDQYNEGILKGEVSASNIQSANGGVAVSTYRRQITDYQVRIQQLKDEMKPLEEKVAEIENDIQNIEAQIAFEKGLDEAAQQKLDAAESAMNSALDRYNSVSGGNAADAHDALQKLNNATAEWEKAKGELDARKASLVYSNLTSQKTVKSMEKTNVQNDLTAKTNEHDKISEELTKLEENIGKVLGLDGQLDAIRDAREEVEKAQKKVDEAQETVDKEMEENMENVVTAPISGTITELKVQSGGTTPAGEENPVAIMQPEGKGYTVSFSVTNEQARRLSVGDQAELVNSWRYDDLRVTLSNIKPDTTDPGQKKLLTFDVVGDDVSPGQTLNLSVGQKSANYDLIVPNSAIREDNNGKFILIVESKSSPLGTRYTASRVDVEVIASDDTQSAVSGALYGYEFVITTSTKPVEAGKLVRLADN